jgi:carbonic anhydrase
MFKDMSMSTDRYGRPKIKSGRDQSVVSSLVDSAIDVAKAATSLIPKNELSTSLKFDEKHPDVLVIQCSDGRYTSIVSELMQSNGIARYDVMAMPGGPALLDMASASILQSEACRAGTSFLIKGHNTKRIWLLAHSECGYYRYNLNGMPRDTIVGRQINDLQRAANWLHSVNKDLAIFATYITQESCVVSFKSIELE